MKVFSSSASLSLLRRSRGFLGRGRAVVGGGSGIARTATTAAATATTSTTTTGTAVFASRGGMSSRRSHAGGSKRGNNDSKNNNNTNFIFGGGRSFSSSAADADDDDPAPNPTGDIGRYDLDDPECNVTHNIAGKVGRDLHLRDGHPLGILKKKIVRYFDQLEGDGGSWNVHERLSPVVSVGQNFDSLRIPETHVSRSKSDTYYLNSDTVLRTHTSAHQVELLRRGERDQQRFLVVGDVYRRDEVDRSHYPVFHQMEGVKLFDAAVAGEEGMTADDIIERDLKKTLEGLAEHLFGSDIRMRWVDEYFPFTHPSYELEIYFKNPGGSGNDTDEGASDDNNDDNGDDGDGEWMEVLGCGVIHPDILRNAGMDTEKVSGWAFGLGLERLAMIMFGIPDIRLFWTGDDRFHDQFRSGEIVPFRPYSKYPPCHKDISFWIAACPVSINSYGDDEDVDGGYARGTTFHINDFHDLVRSVAGDVVESVRLIDLFQHPQTNRISHCYRISFRSMDRSLTNEEIDIIQDRIRHDVVHKFNVELR